MANKISKIKVGGVAYPISDSNFETYRVTNDQAVTAINAKIPTQASSSNQLADKEFVNSSISTNTADFKGTFNSLQELEAVTTADANDYGFVISTDEAGNTVYKRYKYADGAWVFEYNLNNSSFTAAQWAAIQSGITTSLVDKLNGIEAGAQKNAANTVIDASYVHTDNNYTSTEKSKLSGVETGAQVNVLEGVKVDGTELPITDKNVNIDLSGKIDTADSETNSDEFVYRQTGGGLDIEAKNARISSIKGKTLAWNQLRQDLDNTASAGITAVQNQDGSITLTGTSTSTAEIYFKGYDIAPANHKILFLLSGFVNSFVGCYGPSYSAWGATGFHNRESCIAVSQKELYRVEIRIEANTTVNETVKINIIDLTLLFGAGNEPAIVAEFEALFPEAYYEYNAGTLISNDAEAVESVGFNLWDEEWELGCYDNSGTELSSSSYIRTKNYIQVFGGDTYYVKTPKSVRYYFYDANKAFISGAEYATNETMSVPLAACYLRFYVTDSYGTIYNHDICINLSDPAKNGTYEPYRKSTMRLGLNSIKVKSHNIWDEEWGNNGLIDNSNNIQYIGTSIYTKNYIPVKENTEYSLTSSVSNTNGIRFYDSSKNLIDSPLWKQSGGTFTTPSGCAYIRADFAVSTYGYNICINVSSSFNGQYEPHGDITITGGLKSAGSVYDEIVGNKYIKRVGSVDLGSLTWKYSSSGFFYMVNPFPVNISNVNIVIPSICGKYANAGIIANTDDINFINAGDKIYTIHSRGDVNSTYVYIKDSAYSDATIFTTAMSGVYLYYELATPIEYELVEPIRTDYPVDKLGTERVISDSTPICPFNADIIYSEANVKDIEIEGITDYLKRSELTDELDKLQDIESGAQVNKIEHIQINGTEQTISNKTVNLPAYPTTLPASDVYEWAKASTKPSYNLSEIGNADDVKAIENLSGTSGFLKKTAANSWSLDTNTYITARDLGEADLLTRINTLAYGIQWSKNSSTCTRIGNPLLHRTLPIQSQMKGCVEKNGEPVYWLDPSNWAYKANGDPSVLDGTDGYVRDYIPRFYGKSWDTEDYGRVMISTIKIDDTWVEIPEHFEDAYESALDRTNLKLCSVVNTSAQYRGGTNSSTYDSYEAMRSLLGKPATNFSRANARTYASNAGSELLNYNIYKWVFLWLPVIEYANFDLQTAINNNLTAEGYHQGGLGNGATTFSPWSAYNGYNPIIPCGLTNSLGNFSGQVGIDYSAFDSYSAGTVYANRYRGLECPFGDVWTNLDGIIVDANHSDYDLVYTCDDPSKYSDSITSAYTNTSRSIHTDGYVKEFDLGSTGEITAISVGGGKADYHYTGSVNSTLRTVLAGGKAHDGGYAGPGFLASDGGVYGSYAYIGFRTIKRIY